MRELKNMAEAQRMREVRQKRRSSGLCYQCGKPTENIGSSCNACRKEFAAVREARKANGICVTCGQKKAAQGRKSCTDCLKRFNIYGKEHYALHRESHLEAVNRRRQELIDAGLCYRCRKPTDRGYGLQCSSCLEITNARQRGYKKRKAGSKMITDSYCKPSFEII